LQELQNSRAGGQIALKGFTYQLLYTCYLILSEVDSHASFLMEGIEDIDKVMHKLNSSGITHIQIKHSSSKQNASLMPLFKISKMILKKEYGTLPMVG